MNRKLRTLGMALLGTSAIGAMTAPTASAVTQDHFTSDAAKTFLTAKLVGVQTFKVETSGEDKITCSAVKGKGAIEGKEVTEVTVEPAPSSCTIFKSGSSISATITPNGCHYRFTGETASTVTPGQHGGVHLVCPEGVDGMETDVTALKIPCLNVPPQIVSGVGYANDSLNSKAINLNITAHGIDSEATETSVCDAKFHTDGQYTGTTVVEGFKDAAHTEAADLSIVET